ncbi:type IV pilus twitching motility protein PilT [Desulfoluna spongiiphila]|uniref:type IV pilus twitching motility protein PilT n=1 Tax=Desulfoluna spongiiphila TaxID=419481 RepID=UPI001258AADE|nr:PilT/PilU family type 4a pilus ATPase [Desulfoluna spongiiphila]VVS94362.1 pilus retraction protein pilt [Desulfoluna spongiiphila]
MAELDKVFQAGVNLRASDVHVVPGEPIILRRKGGLVKTRTPKLTTDQTQRLITELLSDEEKAHLARENQLDFSYEIKGLGRFRGSAMAHNRGLSAAFRVIPPAIPLLSETGLPEVVAKVLDQHQGLILVTGATGMGKTTTLAAMVDFINERKAHHILTVEDPIEFVHPKKKGVVNQRQVGRDTHSYLNALKGALREDPDVIVIGELRDLETISLAISAAETGHLVIGTLSTTNAPKTVDRIIDSYPPGEQSQIRATLAETLKAVVTQKLIPSDTEDRMLMAAEILMVNLPVAGLIRDSKVFQIPNLMQTGKGLGMKLMDESVKDLLDEGLISVETALMHVESETLQRQLKAKLAG